MIKLNGFSKLPNIALQHEHSVYSIVFIARYPDTNNQGGKSSSLTHYLYMWYHKEMF